MATIEREEYEREIAGMVGDLRTVKMDVGSFLVLSTEASNEQRLALARLVHRYRPSCKRVLCTTGGLGLPSDYVLFNLHGENDEVFLVGGIDPEGRVST